MAATDDERQIGQLTPSKARTRQREQGALKDEGIDLMVMPEGLKGRLPR